MWAELAAFINANTSETLLISIMGTILIWMYKQFKDMIDRERQGKLENLQLRIGLFTKLEIAIASAIHLNNDESKQQMYALLGECGPYLSQIQRAMVRDYCKHFDPALLHALQAIIVNEVDKLTGHLEKMMEHHNSDEWLNYINRLYAPVWPIILIGGIILYSIYIFTLVWQGDTLWIQVSRVLFGINLLVAATIIIGTINMLIKREFGKQCIKRWIAVILVGFSPLLFLIFNRLSPIRRALFITNAAASLR